LRTGSLDSAMDYARQRAELARAALSALPPSPWRDALSFLAEYSVDRKS